MQFINGIFSPPNGKKLFYFRNFRKVEKKGRNRVELTDDLAEVNGQIIWEKMLFVDQSGNILEMF